MTCKFVSMKRKLDYADVLIYPTNAKRLVPRNTSGHDISLEREFTFSNTCKTHDISMPPSTLSQRVWKGIPIIASLPEFCDSFAAYSTLSKKRIITTILKSCTLVDYKTAVETKNIKLNPDLFMVSTGISDNEIVNMIDIIDYTKCRWIYVDYANTYTDEYVRVCGQIRQMFPQQIIVAGNVMFAETAKRLFDEAGVDLVKIGMNRSSYSTSFMENFQRHRTGIGMPKLSAILDMKEELCKYNDKSSRRLIGGGIWCPGDVAKAFVAGADFVIIDIEYCDNYESNNVSINTLQHTIFCYLSGLKCSLRKLGTKNLVEFEENGKFCIVK